MHAREGFGKNTNKKQNQNQKKHTQIYKNMPLDSYQQLRNMGALCTEKVIHQYLQQ